MAKHIISHSEVEAFTQCQKKHDYAHIQKLQPKSSSISLQRGNAGHTIFETFFQLLKDGASVSDAKHISIMENPKLGEYELGPRMEASTYVGEWINTVWPSTGWKVIDVEREFRIPVNENLTYAFKIDLIIEHKGVIKIVDHKFTYDAYSEDLIGMLPQMPRYAGALQQLGIPVKGGIYDFIRTRPLKNMSDRFKLVPVDFNDTRVQESILDYIDGATQIIERKEQRGTYRSLRTINKMNCDNCGFQLLCSKELSGYPTELIRSHSFEPNTYGYSEE